MKPETSWVEFIIGICLVGACIVMIILALFKDCEARDIWIYDQDGSYEGSLDEYGNQYDQDGAYKGMIDSMGNIYDRDGSWQRNGAWR